MKAQPKATMADSSTEPIDSVPSSSCFQPICNMM